MTCTRNVLRTCGSLRSTIGRRPLRQQAAQHKRRQLRPRLVGVQRQGAPQKLPRFCVQQERALQAADPVLLYCSSDRELALGTVNHTLQTEQAWRASVTAGDGSCSKAAPSAVSCA